MTFLPIVERELRVAARQRATYWMRLGFALVAIIIGFFVYLDCLQSSPRRFGQQLFEVLGVLSMLYALGACVFLTADCLSEEKRKGTLGLLFLTDLKGYDVVLGKLAATSMRGFYGLLAVFPLLALPVMVGGISNAEFCRCAVVLVNTFLFSLAAGVLVSTLSQSARKAMAAAFSVLIFFNLILPAAAGLILSFRPAFKRLGYALLAPSPFTSLYWSSDSRFMAFPRYYWGPVAVTFVLASLFLVLAILIAPRSWQDKPARPGAARWRAWWNRLVFGSSAQRESFRHRLLGVNPFYWLAERVWFKPARLWTRLGLVAFFWGWGCVVCGREWFNEGVYFPTAILLNGILKFGVASEAGRQLGEDRKAGTLELLLSTPLGVNDILRGQWLALRRQFFEPLKIVVGVQLIFLAASLQRESFHDNPVNPMVWLGSLVMLVADLGALGWVGMWVALTAKKPGHITALTIARILILPWLMFFGIVAVIAGVHAYYGFAFDKPTWKFFVGFWFVLGMITDAGFGLFARWQVRHRFRELALSHFSPAAPSRLAHWLAGLLARHPSPGGVLPVHPSNGP